MTDHPIIFSAPMIRALLDGRKTQTRRALRPQPTPPGVFQGILTQENIALFNPVSGALIRDCQQINLPYAPGDRLYVREAWRMPDSFDKFSPTEAASRVKPRHKPNVFYEADGFVRSAGASKGNPGRYRHARFMPRWASRLTLIVTDVRVQRLRDISEADAVAEGIESYAGLDPDCHGFMNYRTKSEDGWWLPATDSFRTLWNDLHGPDAWDANPWACAITFTVHRCNIEKAPRHD